MIKKIKLYGVLAALVLCGTSCLDQDPRDAILAEGAINSVETANQAVIGIYSKFKSTALYSGYLTLLPDIQTDLVHAVQGYSNSYGDIWRWNDIYSTNREITAVYGELYSVIGRCNFFFQEVEKLTEVYKKDETALSKLDMYRGEAHFARALAYSELVKLFCKAYESAEQAADELGVVLVSKYPSNGTPLKRATMQESYQFILDDLALAANYLAIEEGSTATYYNASYFTEGAVNSLYARLYLYMRNWEKAVEYASKVIDSGYYELSSASSIYSSAGMSYYNYLWRYDNSTEVIWKVAFDITSYGGALGQPFLNYDFASYRPDYVPSEPVLNKYASADLRYSAFFVNRRTGYSHGLTWPLLRKYEGNQEFTAQNILHVNMPKVFRLSEQYLIRAEAYCELGSYTLAGRDITTLRKARYSSYGTSTPISANTWQEVVYDERLKELYMEGFRLQDLKRWKLGFKRQSQEATVSPGNTLEVAAGDVRFVWPIPQHELNSPGNEIVGNESNY